LRGEPHFGVVVFGTENDVRDVSQPNESSLVLTHHKFFEIIRSVQVGVRSEIYLKQRTFGAPNGLRDNCFSIMRCEPEPGEMLSAAIRSGFIQIRIAK
jgi:hypothetical protein